MKRNNSDDFLYMLMPARLSAQDRIAEDEMNQEEFSEDVQESENEIYEQQAAPENSEGEPQNENHEDENYQQ